MINAILLGYAALIGLAVALRWRYRIWFTLLAVVLGGIALERVHLRDAQVVAQAPAYGREVVDGLRARPWPEQPAELAQLIASFRAVGDPRDANVLQPLYRLQVAHGLAGEPVEHFGSVAEALAWTPPEPKPGSHTSAWREGVEAERRALAGMLEVAAPRISGWPPELAQEMPLGADASEIAPGVWLTVMPENPHVGTVRFAVGAHNRGDVSISIAQVSVNVHARSESDAAGSKRPLISCHATLHDVEPGQTRLFGCALTVSLGTDKRPLQRTLDHVEEFRAGALDVRVHAGGSLDESLLKVPDAEPLIAAQLQRLAELKESDKQAQARRDALEPSLTMWLIVGVIFAAGMLLPGLRRGCLSAPVTLALAVGGFVAAMIVGWEVGTHTPGVAGWELIIAIFSGFEYGVPFIGGLLFGNLVYIRQREKTKAA